jgi:hypothetical protein
MEYNLFMGGQAGNTSNRMVPSGSPEGITGYADHQRSRDYSVTRQLDFRPPKPWGGADITVDCKDYEWYKQLVAAGGDLIVGDILNVIALTPNSRLDYVSVNVVLPKTGLGFNVIQRINADPGTPPTSTIALPAAVTGYLAPTAMGAVAGLYTSQQLPTATASRPKHSFISLEITAVPTVTPPAGKLDGLFVIVQAEVADWGSYDFNGNA